MRFRVQMDQLKQKYRGMGETDGGGHGRDDSYTASELYRIRVAVPSTMTL